MEITVTIKAPEIVEVIHDLTEAIVEVANTPVKVMIPPTDAAPSIEESATQNTTVAPTPAPVPATETVPAPATETVPAPATETVPAPAAPMSKPITLEMLCEAGARLVENEQMAQVIAILGKYGVQAVNQLPAAHYEAFAADLRALGADI